MRKDRCRVVGRSGGAKRDGDMNAAGAQAMHHVTLVATNVELVACIQALWPVYRPLIEISGLYTGHYFRLVACIQATISD